MSNIKNSLALLDRDFLKRLDEEKEREVFAKVVSLDFNENPLEEITGRVTGGSISIDGNSAVRRTCSLSLVAEELNIHDYYWGLNTKFKLLVGLKNKIDSRYPGVIWFPQGTYLISGFNTSQALNNYTVSINGKDKMSLLNGDVGGTITALSVDFGCIEIQNDDGTSTFENIPLKEIIQEAVHEYAREPLHNIIINDLDDCGVELLDYRGDIDMYLLVNIDKDEVVNINFNPTPNYRYKNYNIQTGEYDKEWSNIIVALNDPLLIPDNMVDFLDLPIGSHPSRLIAASDDSETPTEYKFIKAEANSGTAIGYRVTNLTYAGDLIGSVGQSITTAVLDKIKNMLGDFEYFYDLDGRFIFQRKKTFANVSWNNIQEDADGEMYVENAAGTSACTYSFENGVLVTSFANAPNLLNLKNDFSIWGTRKGIGGKDIPVHMRYAIDQKPFYYKNREGLMWTTDLGVLDLLKEQAKTEVSSEIKYRIESFEPRYAVYPGLQVPEKQPDGSFSPGWWDIRDWYEYYFALKQEMPNGTMKWYSHNNMKGCVKLNTIPGFESADEDSYCWLLIISPATGYINTQHGTGNPTLGRDCYYYESVLDVSGNVKTTQVSPAVTKYFQYPYAGCSDNHTYLSFLKDDVEKSGNLVYFYNPNFPNAASFEEVVNEQVEKEFNEYLEKGLINLVDWREIIYQMSLDYLDYDEGYHSDDFNIRLEQDNILNNEPIYPGGYTGYEIYYTDLNGFWRDLYNPFYDCTYKIAYVTRSNYEADPTQYYWFVQCEEENAFNEQTVYYTKRGYETYQKRNALTKEKYEENPGNYYYVKQGPSASNLANYPFDEERTYFTKATGEYNYRQVDEYSDKDFWRTDIATSPETLNFWFDFLDSNGGELSQFSVRNVGSRPKAENDSDVKAIYFRDIPTVIFVSSDITEEELREQHVQKPGYTFVKLNSYLENMFSISSQGKSAKDVVDNWLYNYSYCTDSITISALPVYYLEPNTRIFVRDDNSNINGEYIMTRIQLPLDYKGMMSITANKAAERIY